MRSRSQLEPSLLWGIIPSDKDVWTPSALPWQRFYNPISTLRTTAMLRWRRVHSPPPSLLPPPLPPPYFASSMEEQLSSVATIAVIS